MFPTPQSSLTPVFKARVSMAHFICLPFPQQPGGKMVAAAKASVPTIQDQASAMQLSQCAKNLGTALAELRTAAQKVQSWSGLWNVQVESGGREICSE